MIEEWESPYNSFNPIKILLWRQHLEGCAKGDYLPPISVNLYLTDLCNHNCWHCINWGWRQKSPASMPPGHALKLADFFKEWGTKSVCLGGGESTMHNDLVPVLYRLSENGIQIGIATNGGSHLTKEKLKAMAETCTWIGFSIDAGDIETHSLIHGVDKGEFGRVLKNMEWLVDHGADVTYKMLIHPAMVHTIFEAARIAKDLGATGIQMRPVGWVNIERTKGQPPIDFKPVLPLLREQVEAARSLEDYKFKVYCVLQKFGQELETKVKFSRCWAAPLTITAGADGWYYNCAPAGSQIYTIEGLKAIEDINELDVVLTHRGEFKPVKRTWNGRYSDIVSIKHVGWYQPLRLTPEHPVFAIKHGAYCKKRAWLCYPFSSRGICSKCKDKYEPSPSFIPACEIEEGDFVLTPILKGDKWKESVQVEVPKGRKGSIIKTIKMDSDFAWLLGLYLAEGSIQARKGSNHRQGIVFGLGSHEKDIANRAELIIRKKFGLSSKTTIDGKRLTLSVSNSRLAHIFEYLCGRHADRKRLDKQLMKMRLRFQKKLLKGWQDGDGFHRKKDDTYHITSISHELIYQMWSICLRLGIPATVYKWKTLQKNKRQAYTLFLNPKRQKRAGSFIWNGYLLSKVTKVEPIPLAFPVYNLEVGDDNSYVLNAVATHNCCDRMEYDWNKMCHHYPDPEEILLYWNSEQHRELVRSINPHDCCRCTFSSYQEIVEKVILEDKMMMNFP